MGRKYADLGDASAVDRPSGAPSADVLIRNHDFQWGYDVDVEIVDEGGSVLEERYYLQPGATRSEVEALPTGTYAVRVVLDNRREATERAHVDGSPDSGVLVELGNGAVSVHDGLYR